MKKKIQCEYHLKVESQDKILEGAIYLRSKYQALNLFSETYC